MDSDVVSLPTVQVETLSTEESRRGGREPPEFSPPMCRNQQQIRGPW